MRCTRCGQDAGSATLCPACGGSTVADPAPAASPTPAVPPASALAEPEPSFFRRWRQTLLVIGIAVALGVAAGGLARKVVGPAPDASCEKLCEFSDVPVVVANPAWQEQIRAGNCRCNALPKKAPPARAINHPPPGH